ncbi:LysE family transporter [Peribacillus simplex]|uniref:LysE/ArgO family amino acid transporter n=1 Tax=Peribacillus TaxID=2675229 RepID=UPI000777C0EA|nr:LysE family transporter [Peribacillus simplex]AMM95126.1 LysE family L-lysine exporter [Peribacillus simplex]MDM5292454.1 LysE family transporter [Peribacillus simplex]MDW7614795.1 LysE family transporter [Peribacillus simplex]SNS80068.1 L-lysine exporter family protein LysE/ArgO [Bacillus sp. OK838]
MGPFFHGLLLALGLILPLGVQNVFIFNQGAIQPTLKKALPATITAAICDTVLILLAILGVSLIVMQYDWLRLTLIIFGVIFLLYMGFQIWSAKANPQSDAQTMQMSTKKQIVFALSVSLLNPHAILDTIGVIGSSSLVYSGMDKVIFTGTCIVVSWCWFHGLCFAGRLLKKVDASGKFLGILNKISAIIIWITALYMVKSIF